MKKRSKYDLHGLQFGELTVIGTIAKGNQTKWLARDKDGNERIATTSQFLKGNITTANIDNTGNNNFTYELIVEKDGAQEALGLFRNKKEAMEVGQFYDAPVVKSVEQAIEKEIKKDQEVSGKSNSKLRDRAVLPENRIKGVARIKATEKYQAYIMHEGRRVHLGTFETYDAAANARIEKERSLGLR